MGVSVNAELELAPVGSSGWCYTDGRIHFSGNIGKWPSVEEVLEEWGVIANAFPYLDSYATLMSGEGYEEHIVPVVTIRVIDGAATLLDNSVENSGNRVIWRGIPDSWIDEYAERFRKVLKEKGQ